MPRHVLRGEEGIEEVCRYLLEDLGELVELPRRNDRQCDLGLYAQCELEAGTRKIYFERVQLEGVATLGNVVAMSAAVLPSGWPGMEYSRAGIPYGNTHTHAFPMSARPHPNISVIMA
jgi:hypothetical protein